MSRTSSIARLLQHVVATYDTDLAIKTNISHDLATHMLLKSLNTIKGSHWSSHR